MADVTFRCANCGHRQLVPDRLVGRKVRCPKCDTKQVLRGSGKEEGGGTTTIMRRETAAITRPPARSSESSQADGTASDEFSLDGVEFEPSSLHTGTTSKHTLPAANVSLERLTQAGSLGNDQFTIRPQAVGPNRPVEVTAGYELSRELGRGGMGVVWSSTQKALQRTVAIKTLLAGQDGNSAAHRFHAEAMIMAKLEHPNIMPVHDLISSERGELQLVMKKIDGMAWRDLLYPATAEQVQRGLAMKLDDHLEILLKVCDGLAFAHARGILHLDLKPANVMVGAFGEVLLLDWGCALAYEDPGNEALPTVAGYRGLSGTPAYMAPEMARQTGDLGPWTDIYLAGAVLYELVTGSAPHKADSVQSSLALAAANTIQAPHRQRGRVMATELIELARQAMDEDRARRPANIAEFAAQVRNYRAHAEAITLVETAKQRRDEALKGGEHSDDAFRLALAASDQAVALWPGYIDAQATQALISLDYADFSLASGAYQVARTKARSVEATAVRLQLDQLAVRARNLQAQAQSEERSQLARQRTIRFLLIGIATLLIAGVISSIVLLSVMTNTNSRLRLEQEERKVVDSSGQRDRKTLIELRQQMAPLRIEQALRELNARRVDTALDAVNQALVLNPARVEGYWLKANLLAAKRNYPAAIDAASDFLAKKPGDPAGASLLALLKLINANATPQLEAELGEHFLSNNLIPLADGRKLTKESLAKFYMATFERFWPGCSRLVQIDNGQVLFARGFGSATGKDPLTGAATIVDLSPLRELPIRELGLADTRIADLGPLAGMPLRRLDLARTPVRDLRGLSGMSLEWLDLSDTNVLDLGPLTGMPLSTLLLARTGVSDLQPLIGRPLKQLDLSDTRITDLSPLKYMKLERLALDNTRVGRLDVLQPMPLAVLSLRNASLSDLADLRGAQIRSLDLAGNTALQNISPLAGLPLEELTLDHCANVSDLQPLANLPLKRLSLIDTRVTDVSALAGLPLERIDLDPKAVTKGMEALRAIRSLQSFGPAPVLPAATFWRRYDQGQ